MTDFNFDDYLTEDEKKDIAKQAFMDVCRKKSRKDFERIVTNSAYSVVWEAVDRCFDEDVEKFLRDKVLSILDDLSEFNIFRTPNAWDRAANAPYTVLCEQVKANKDLLDDKIKSAIGNLTKKDMKEVAMKLVEQKMM